MGGEKKEGEKEMKGTIDLGLRETQTTLRMLYDVLQPRLMVLMWCWKHAHVRLVASIGHGYMNMHEYSNLSTEDRLGLQFQRSL
jgi:hypothetical protein